MLQPKSPVDDSLLKDFKYLQYLALPLLLSL